MRSEHAVAVGTEQVTAAPITGLRRGALRGYRWALLAFLLAGVAQIFLAGLGVFSLEDQGLAAAGDSAFAPHRDLGFTMAGIALLILVLAVIARPGARAIAGSAVLVVLTSLMQSLLAGFAEDHAVYGALHALDGLLILGIAAYLYFWSRRRES
jgi:predicted anti-sigma-YlaC factor YlaD